MRKFSEFTLNSRKKVGGYKTAGRDPDNPEQYLPAYQLSTGELILDKNMKEYIENN